MISVPTFVIHVKGCTERELYITKELNKHSISFEFILDGNKEALTKDILDQYFVDFMHDAKSATSCAFKHLLAYERIIANNYPYALILEDDIALHHSFNEIFNQSLLEIKQRPFSNFLVFYENSVQKYIKRSQLQKNQLLYKAQQGRCTGAYLVSLEAAKVMMEYVYEKRCATPIDWFHNNLAAEEFIELYWCQPHIAEQKSHNGTLPSLIDVKKKSLFKKLSYPINKFYKKNLLYKFR